MKKTSVILLAGHLMAIFVGCRTQVSSSGTTPLPVSHNESAHIAVLSNEVVRLNQRILLLEQDWGNLKPDIQFMQTLINETRYEPVVEEKLIGAPTNTASTNTTTQTLQNVMPPDTSPPAR